MVNEYDDIDKLFQESLDSELDKSSKWNDPGQDIFDSAMEAIDDSKSDRKIFPWWIMGSLAVALLLVIGIASQYAIPPSTSHSQKVEDRLLENKTTTQLEEVNKIRKDEIEALEAPISALKEDVTPLSFKLISPEETLITIPPQNIIRENNNSLSPPQIQLTSISTDAEDAEPVLLSQIKKDQRLLANPSEETARLTTILAKPLSRSEKVVIGNNEIIEIITKEKSTRRLFIAPILNSTSFGMISPSVPGAELTKYDRSYLGGGLQVGLEQALKNNWIVHYAVGYQYLQNNSLYKKEIIFDEDLVTDLGGLQRNYSTALTIADPTGQFKENFEALIQKNILQDNDIMKQKSHIHSHFHIINVNVGASYHRGIFSSWDIYLGVSLDINYVLAAERNVETDLYKQTEIVMADKLKSTSDISLNPISLGISPVAGIRYRINSIWDLGVTSSYHIGITPTNKVNSSSVGKTYLRDWRTGVSIGYNF